MRRGQTWMLGSLLTGRGIIGLSGKSADGYVWASSRIGRDGQKRQAALLSSYSHKTPHLVREAWFHMWGWYRDVANRPPPPARVSLETLTAEHVKIYTHVPPKGKPIPIEVAPFPVDENILGGEDTSKAAMRLRLHCSGGPSGMRAKHLIMWLRVAMQE